MMKKEYVKPVIQVEEFIVESMLATSLPVAPGENPDGSDPEANERRGGWGSLWD